ncbi:MAG: hypothetical protein JNL98_31895 [Bryobacterales bacterium]|nr:hypothetical protein [Bryobacterales bacterium]
MWPPKRFYLAGWMLIAIGLLALRPSCLRGDELRGRHRNHLAENPVGTYFRLRTANGQKAFHRGERIPLIAEISSEIAGKYRLTGATCGLEGRLPREHFLQGLENVADPYQRYLQFEGAFGHLGSFFDRADLSLEPHLLSLHLNQWVRFDQPGTYQFYFHIPLDAAERNLGEPYEYQFLASNMVEITILPDHASWTRAKLAEIRSILFNRPRPVPWTPSDPFVLAQWDLRYLATPEALAMAFDHARRFQREPDPLVIMGQRDLKTATAMYEEYLADRNSTIRGADLQQLATLQLMQSPDPEPEPISGSENGLEDFWKVERRQRERRDAQRRAEALRLIPAASLKEGEVRRVSGETIAEYAEEEARAARLIPPHNYGLTREELIAGFATFPKHQQDALLGPRWELIQGPEIVPALRKVLDSETESEKPSDMPEIVEFVRDWPYWQRTSDRAWARLLELAPDLARDVVARDFAKGNPRLAALALDYLPPGEMPEAAATLHKWLHFGERARKLLAKFGPKAVVKENLDLALGGAESACNVENLAVYVARAFRELGSEYGARALRLVLKREADEECVAGLLGDVSRLHWDAAVEREALRLLDGPALWPAVRAAGLLSTYGGRHVEPLLWSRLAKLDRKSEASRRLAEALMEALSQAPAWFFGDAEAARLLPFCDSGDCRALYTPNADPKVIEVPPEGWGGRYELEVDRYRMKTFSDLKNKLREFPEGTPFVWCAAPYDQHRGGFTKGQLATMFDELKQLLGTRLSTITPGGSEVCFQRLR